MLSAMGSHGPYARQTAPFWAVGVRTHTKDAILLEA